MVKSLRKALPDAFLDCHLMVLRPEAYVEPFKAAGFVRLRCLMLCD